MRARTAAQAITSPDQTTFDLGPPLPFRNAHTPGTRLFNAAATLLEVTERGQPLEARLIEQAMTDAFGASDAEGAWLWKDAYEACEIAQAQYLRRHLPAMQRRARSSADLLDAVGKLRRRPRPWLSPPPRTGLDPHLVHLASTGSMDGVDDTPQPIQAPLADVPAPEFSAVRTTRYRALQEDRVRPPRPTARPRATPPRSATTATATAPAPTRCATTPPGQTRFSTTLPEGPRWQ
jgi:hypothetical protein